MNVKDCIAIVTGGASGLGEANVRNIIDKGGKAIILDQDDERGIRLQEELGENVLFMKTDVRKEEDVKAATQACTEKFGEINLVLNCAGIAYASKLLGRKGMHQLDSFKKVMDINLIGTFNVIRITAEKMLKNEPNASGERGIIINTASVAAFEGQIGQAAYSASKGGVVSMTLPLARELAEYGIRVMTIAPGLFHTPMFDSLPEEARKSLGSMVPFPKRLGEPGEHAMLVESIIQNPMLNGETIRLDGGIRMQSK
ncbi:3-hydroxyacyl-CoA dehydrogenase [Bacillus sp. DTU_2020_1000418_1_SI_GHA_SEK_038]|uniref:3-hydroxyacyl-CoA dehydrogenase n=1 Tax=Bacillus sp. DTU_2020_1000418_1_SI_GHA_SEK_038 TaxID=3077585 RepID=UPI0028EBA645|nr:3-hydroxyacyl-CoA dehydrogenase [Bacillus sp. DTU_2020_1000418_1_SI_GHA_SEK_038]WNS73759.1 3-hydroxyacyl-CoA dehydrogenase [Bacillus sp. DTU_2020_1000418_1_SI_GHA_SEK_038]